MKLVFVCFDYKSSNLRKQPWRYVDELTRKLDGNVRPVVVTDVESDVDSIPVRTVSSLKTTTGPSDELVEAVRAESPDVVATLLGPSSFIRPNSLAGAVETPTIGVMSSPLYDLREVGRVGAREFYRHPSYLLGHVTGALTPDRFIRRHLDQFNHLITLTRDTADRLVSASTTTSIDVVRPGIDPFDLELPPESEVEAIRHELRTDGGPVILYFTSPLTLRGTDTLVRAFARVRESEDGTLVVLSRQDGGGLSDEEQYLSGLASDLGIADSFTLLPRNLTPEGVKAHLRASDVVALPYKIVISGVPVSILETMAVGRPVVTTTTDGLPELIEDRGQLVEPNDVESLALTLEERLEDPDEVGQQNRERIRDRPTWGESREKFLETLEAIR